MVIAPKHLTRYAKERLLELKSSKYSQCLPVCLTKARIVQLDIFAARQTTPMSENNIMPLMPNFQFEDKMPMIHFPHEHQIPMTHFSHKIENGAKKGAENGKERDAPEW